jgi:DNA-binding NarL/FixJ family response regulator
MPSERVLLVDDHAGFRASAAALLEAEGLSIVGSAASGEEALAVVDDLDPDIILLDLYLPGLDGVDVAWRLSDPRRNSAIILISSHEEAAADPRVASAPVRGFLSKRDLTCAAIRELLG